MEDAAEGITAQPPNPTSTLYQIFLSIGKRKHYMYKLPKGGPSLRDGRRRRGDPRPAVYFCQTRTQSMRTSSSSGIGSSQPPPFGPAHGAASTESLM